MKVTLIPKHILDLKPYQAGKPIEDLMREKNISRVSKLASNENPLGPSPQALSQIQKKLPNIRYYPDMYATLLREQLASIYDLKTTNIITSSGSEGVMACLMRSFIQLEDEIITAQGTFIGFSVLSQSVGAQVRFAPRTKDYRYSVENIVKLITDKTKLIYIANPDNPLGTFITRKEFDFLMSHVPQHCIVILDEAYFEFAKHHSEYPDSMDYRYDNVITLRTFSKAYGLAGLRAGYGFAHEDFILQMYKVKLPFEPNSLAQATAVGALADKNHLEKVIKNNITQYEKTFSFLKRMNLSPIPSVANFITFKGGSESESRELYEGLLNRGVILRPLDANGWPGFMRVSLGTSEEMEHFFEAMGELKK